MRFAKKGTVENAPFCHCEELRSEAIPCKSLIHLDRHVALQAPRDDNLHFPPLRLLTFEQRKDIEALCTKSSRKWSSATGTV